MSAATLLERDLVSEEEFLSLPESMEHVELVDGEVIVSPAPAFLHQHVLLRLYAAFERWERNHPPATVGLAPVDIRLAQGRILQPDLFLVLAGISPRAPAPLELVPDLIVEIVSGRRSYDRITKRAIYAEAGVPEYWIVDPLLGQIELVAGSTTLAVVTEGSVESHVAPGLVVALSEIFPE